METSSRIKGAEPKAAMFVDLFHSIGTGRVASFFAWISALVIVFRIGELSCKPWPIILFVVANLIAGALLWIHVRNFHRVSLQAQGFIEEVLHDALMEERATLGNPIETRVVIRR